MALWQHNGPNLETLNTYSVPPYIYNRARLRGIARARHVQTTNSSWVRLVRRVVRRVERRVRRVECRVELERSVECRVGVGGMGGRGETCRIFTPPLGPQLPKAYSPYSMYSTKEAYYDKT